MALLTKQQISLAGLEAVYSAAAASDTIGDAGVGGTKILHVKNGGGSDDTITIVVPGTYLGVNITDPTVVVTAGEERFIAIPKEAIDPSTGLVTVQHSFVTSVTQALLSA